MNKNVFDNFISTAREHAAIYISDNKGICDQILAVGHFAVFITRDLKDKDYFNVETFTSYMEKNYLVKEFGSYVFVPCCRIRYLNDMIFQTAKGLGFKVRKDGWKLFRFKEYLASYEHQSDMEVTLQGYEKNLFGPAKSELDLSRFHKVSKNGGINGVIDIEVVNYLMETENMFVVNGRLYLYRDGVYQADENGAWVKNKVQKLLYREWIRANILNQIYNLLLIQESIQKQYEELNRYPVTTINFRNGMYDILTDELHPHDPSYYSMNQIPHDYDKDYDLENGWSSTRKFLEEVSVSEDDTRMLLEYFGYCMTRDTRSQKFMIITGRGGTGKSRVINLLEYIIGTANTCGVPLQDLNKRFYATNLYGKLLNSCADISSDAMESVDVIKKATGEDLLMYEQKGKDPTTFRSYAKLIFSANEIPVNLDEKSNAWYRRLLIFEMDRPPRVTDTELQRALQMEVGGTIRMAVSCLRRLYVERDKREIEPSANSERIAGELNRDADSVLAFLHDCVVKKDGSRIKRSEFFQEYLRYCEENERLPYKKHIFFKNLKRKGIEPRKAGEYFFMGMAFKKNLETGFEPVCQQREIPF